MWMCILGEDDTGGHVKQDNIHVMPLWYLNWYNCSYL